MSLLAYSYLDSPYYYSRAYDWPYYQILLLVLSIIIVVRLPIVEIQKRLRSSLHAIVRIQKLSGLPILLQIFELLPIQQQVLRATNQLSLLRDRQERDRVQSIRRCQNVHNRPLSVKSSRILIEQFALAPRRCNSWADNRFENINLRH